MAGASATSSWRRGRWLLAAAVAIGIAGIAATSCAEASAVPEVVIGAGSSDEQRVLAAVAAEVVGRTGLAVEVRTGLGSTPGLRRQALADQVDLYWDYTGAAWTLGLRESAPPADPLESWERVREADLDLGLRWLEPTAANATFALVVREDALPADERRRTLGWLAGELSSGRRTLCADPDFLARPDGLQSLAAEYGIDTVVMSSRAMDEADAIAAVRGGRCYAALTTATSGVARAAGLAPVADELRVFPAFVVAPVVRVGSPADRVDVAAALRQASVALDTPTMAQLNARAVAGVEVEHIASEFVDGLVTDDETANP